MVGNGDKWFNKMGKIMTLYISIGHITSKSKCLILERSSPKCEKDRKDNKTWKSLVIKEGKL